MKAEKRHAQQHLIHENIRSASHCTSAVQCLVLSVISYRSIIDPIPLHRRQICLTLPSSIIGVKMRLLRHPSISASALYSHFRCILSPIKSLCDCVYYAWLYACIKSAPSSIVIRIVELFAGNLIAPGVVNCLSCVRMHAKCTIPRRKIIFFLRRGHRSSAEGMSIEAPKGWGRGGVSEKGSGSPPPQKKNQKNLPDPCQTHPSMPRYSRLRRSMCLHSKILDLPCVRSYHVAFV